jgi:uncharacterized surface protein with fasciclin (FAS1) repeats
MYMNINILKTRTVAAISLLVTIALIVVSCNKELPVAVPINPPAGNGTVTIGEMIKKDTANYSFFVAAATKVNMLDQLSDPAKEFTVFLPDNAAFRASGFPSVAAVNAQSAATLGAIVSYAIIPGRQYVSDSVPATFPNVQLPTTLTIGALPGTPLPLKLSTFPSKRTNGFWDNNIPVLKPDNKFSNGVVHVVAGIVAPPSQVLKSAIYSNPDLSYFKAAIARADSGMTGLNKLDSLLGYAVTNMTVLVPNNDAFKTLLFGSIYGALLSQGADDATASTQAAALSASPAVFSNPALFSVLTAQTVRGIAAYHFLATNAGSGFQPNIRAFSVNFPETPAFFTTLVNASVAVHPGIMSQATFAGPFVSSLKFTGLGTFPPGGAPYSGAAANAVKMDQHAVNGVFHIIDKVLLPQ